MRLKRMKPKDIIHLDMDAFYPAVEVLDNPELKGKPVIVGGRDERGVVSSASYEARKYGVHSAQPIATARRLCPDGIFLPVRMERYQEVSKKVFEIFQRFTPLVEPLSIDEAFLDVTGSQRLFGSPEEIAKKIRRQVKAELGLTVSAGVAPSKLVAKIASDLEKPDGLTVVPYGKVREFLDPLPIEKLWGAGKATQKGLAFLGVKTIGDLSRLPLEVLERKFGQHGVHLYHMARDMDQREVETEREVKSMGREETFAQDIMDLETVRKKLLSLATQVARRMRRKGFTGRTVTLKVKYKDFVQITRAVTLPEPTDDQGEIFQKSCQLLEETEAGQRPIRLLGIYLSRLVSPDDEKQLSLFNQQTALEKEKKLHTALDTITEKYGRDAVLPGTLLEE
ncbi:MAG: DNA polymerase IV [Deltaproteobacteria bacterium]|nr:DNA polymerase IV [Deltaproteobacteria bacterium]